MLQEKLKIDNEIPGNVHLSAMTLVFSAGVSTSVHSYFDLFTIIRIKNISHPGHNSNGNINCVPKCILNHFTDPYAYTQATKQLVNLEGLDHK